jgi:membrane protein implicated in regulation of membrane protease activity
VLFGRRLTFGVVVLAAQVLLLAMAVAWCVQLTLIAVRGRICFEETNAAILYGEIAGVALIAMFALVVFVMQYRRLTEKRAGDSRQDAPRV